MKYIVIVLLILIQVMNSYGQNEIEEYIIDKHLMECLDSAENQTTAGMVQCAVRAKKEWSKELNKYYTLLLTILSEAEEKQLKSAQKNWIMYYDKEIEFASTIYYNLQGTMWRIVLADRQTELTRQRALELKAYYDNLH